MAGVTNEPYKADKYRGWFKDRHGKRKFFTGTTNKRETLRMAKELEDDHKAARLSALPDKHHAERHAGKAFSAVKVEYLDWGKSQGGRGGRPWGRIHARNKKMFLDWWEKELGLKTLADLNDILRRVQLSLRKLQDAGSAGKSLQNRAEALKAFCLWCVEGEYLADNPLKKLKRFDTTPMTKRRALTPDEIIKLLDVVPEYRRLLYEVAFTTGLRRGELRALSIDDLEVENCGLRLHANWTKNRKPGFQPLPSCPP